MVVMEVEDKQEEEEEAEEGGRRRGGDFSPLFLLVQEEMFSQSVAAK